MFTLKIEIIPECCSFCSNDPVAKMRLIRFWYPSEWDYWVCELHQRKLNRGHFAFARKRIVFEEDDDK